MRKAQHMTSAYDPTERQPISSLSDLSLIHI